MVPNSISELTKENWVKSPWEEGKRANKFGNNKGKSPIAEEDLDKKRAWIDLVTRYAKIEPNSLRVSKSSSMKEFPFIVGLERKGTGVLRIPSQYHPSPLVIDTANIQALMSTPIKVTLNLAEILRIKHELWHEVTACLEKVGVLVPNPSL